MGHQTSKYSYSSVQISCTYMLEVQSFKHLATTMDYHTYKTRHRPSNVQIQLFKCPNTAIQAYKYQVTYMMEVQSFEHMATMMDYPTYNTRHRPSNVQIQQFKRTNIVSLT